MRKPTVKTTIAVVAVKMICPCPFGRSWIDCRARAKAIAPRSPVHVHKVQNSTQKDRALNNTPKSSSLFYWPNQESFPDYTQGFVKFWNLTTIPKCFLVFSRNLSIGRSNQVDQISTWEHIGCPAQSDQTVYLYFRGQIWKLSREVSKCMHFFIFYQTS